MIYDRQWFRDVRAKLDQANSLKTTPPQDAGTPVIPVVPDYGMYAGFASPGYLWSAAHGCYLPIEGEGI